MEKLDVTTDGSSMDIVQDNIAKLKQLFPDVFSEGKIDVEKLQETLGDVIEEKEERYNFTWHGKTQAKRIAQSVSTGTLLPCKEESKHWDSTQNLFIEGDNLEVLKLLQKSYHNQVKMIYIDPPYNTGKEFIYPDNYRDNLDTYMQYTGQKDNEGRKFGTNADTSGRYHTNWLNMMYPRLKLARNLLRDDGVIFISIDDNEVTNLRKLCDEIFGEENFIAQFIHKNNSNKNQSKLVSISTEYILCFSKNIKYKVKNNAEWRVLKKGAKDIVSTFERLKHKNHSLDEIEAEIKALYQRPKYSHLSRWNKVDEKGVFKDENLSREGGPKNYTIKNPHTDEDCVIPPRGWGKSYEDLIKLQEQDLIWYGDSKTAPGWKYYLGAETVSVLDNFFYYDNSIDTKWIKKEFSSLIFDFPKPLEMLKLLVEIQTIDDDIILDFFSGSATTAHAVMDLNSSGNSELRHIMVQLPEPCDKKSEAYKAGYKTIADIGKERIRRAGEKVQKDNANKEGIENLDTGFKVFKLDSSNIKPWDADFDNLEDTLLSHVDNIKQDRSEEDVLYEILLKYGLNLTIPIEERIIHGKIVYIIGFGALIICLDNEITLDVVDGIGALKNELEPEVMRVVFKDGGFKDDVVKTNAIQNLKRFGIDDVKSL